MSGGAVLTEMLDIVYSPFTPAAVVNLLKRAIPSWTGSYRIFCTGFAHDKFLSHALSRRSSRVCCSVVTPHYGTTGNEIDTCEDQRCMFIEGTSPIRFGDYLPSEGSDLVRYLPGY